jgi:tRNA (guanosine-2'-O-)-methyltransferase
MQRSERRTARIREVLRNRLTDLTVVIENIHDPHNVSAILRSCDAVGVQRVELLYTSEPFPRIGRKSSSSAGKWVDRRTHRSVDECYTFLRAEGFVVWATSLSERAGSLYDLDLTARVALVFGNEHRGVSADAAQKADGLFKIPMRGMIESLNVSVACAVSLFEALRQRLASGEVARSGLPQPEQDAMFEDWIKR